MKVIVNNQQIDIEDCVMTGDELDDGYQVVEVPESEEEQFIREYIESDLDKQPNDDIFDRVLEDLSTKELEILPSCLDFTQFLTKKRNDEILKGNSKLIELEILAEQIQQEIDDIIEEYRKEYMSDYIRNYRKELREWWFKHKQKDDTNK